MRQKPHRTLGQRDQQRRGGQAKLSELYEMGRTGRSVFTGEFVEPQDNPMSALDDLLVVLTYTGLFDDYA